MMNLKRITTNISASQMLPQARLVISRRLRIYCVGKAILPENWRPRDAITAAARLMLEVRPYLVMLTEILPSRLPIQH